jgi:hypothetical protein
MPADAPTAPLSPLSRMLDERIVGNGVHQLVCSAGRVAPPLVPAINRLSARVWGDRRFSDASHRVFTTQRSVRFREMEYAVPLESSPSAFQGARARRPSDWRIEFPIEVRVAPPTIGGSRRRRARQRVHRRAPLLARRPPCLFRRRRGDHAPTAAARTGESCTRSMRRLCARYPRFDDFLRCVTASIRRACSATPISTASSA